MSARLLHKPRPWQIALLVTTLALGWQRLIVAGYFEGHWSALFVTGDRAPQAPAVQAEGTYVLKNSDGYDGQFYHAIAHDPLDLHGTEGFLDAPSIRYPRILLPALSFALGPILGIDRAYRLLELAFLYLGVCCTAAWAGTRGQSALWGAAFVLIPGVFISLERELADLPLCALLAAALLLKEQGRDKLCWLALAAAGLTREMGLVAIAGFALLPFLRNPRQLSRPAGWLAAMLPGLLWTAYVLLRIPHKASPLKAAVPLLPILNQVVHFRIYPFGGASNFILNLLDLMALAGLLLSMALGLRNARQDIAASVALALALFGIAMSAAGMIQYEDAYSFARQASPLLTVQLLEALADGGRIRLLPLCLMLPRSLVPVASMTFRAALQLARGL